MLVPKNKKGKLMCLTYLKVCGCLAQTYILYGPQETARGENQQVIVLVSLTVFRHRVTFEVSRLHRHVCIIQQQSALFLASCLQVY